ncbi:MAG: hypothetical protein IT520_01010 [Burkholderiales bacterium]|nr:hypothetical protein [Burkholderiales bacterium]
MKIPRLSSGVTATILAFAAAVAPQAAHAQVKPAKTIEVSALNAISASCTMPSGAGALQKCQAYTVPAGKRLAIRMVTYTHSDDPTKALAGILYGRDAKPADLTISGLQDAVDPRVASILAGGPATVQSSLALAWGSQLVDMVLLAGDVLAASGFFRANPNNNATLAFFGYLVDE